MKMNWLEKMSMNSPIRTLLLHYSEAPLLLRMGGSLEGMNVLEIGCGQGTTTALILKKFKARRVVAIDFDPELVQRARRRLSSFSSSRLELNVGDATAIDSEDQSFDAVVNFAALHHVPNWQEAVSEICRVLKTGGRFFFQEVTRRFLEGRFARTFLEHPKENRFNTFQFLKELERQGIRIGRNFTETFGGRFIYGVGWREEVVAAKPAIQAVRTNLTTWFGEER